MSATPTAGYLQPTWDVIALGVDKFLVSDQEGHSADAFRGSGGVLSSSTGVPGVNADVSGTNSIQVLLPTDRNYAVLMHPAADAGQLTIQKEITTRVQVVQYSDVIFAPGQWLSFALCTDGPGDVRDGTELVTPTASASGNAAADKDGPVVQISAVTGVVTVTASDPSGVLRVFYSTDGVHVDVYTGPFTIACGNPITILAYADDAIGNRSSVRSAVVRC